MKKKIKVAVINPDSIYYGMTGTIFKAEGIKVAVKLDYPKGVIPMWESQLFNIDELCRIN